MLTAGPRLIIPTVEACVGSTSIKKVLDSTYIAGNRQQNKTAEETITFSFVQIKSKYLSPSEESSIIEQVSKKTGKRVMIAL